MTDNRVSPIAVANYLINRGDIGDLTPLKLMKLVYLSHGWNLVYNDGPLVDEQAQAWRYGPVFPSLHFAVRHFADLPVVGTIAPRYAGDFGKLTDDQKWMVDTVVDIYGKVDGIKLSAMTHNPGTPWFNTFKKHGKNSPIADADIRAHLEEK